MSVLQALCSLCRVAHFTASGLVVELCPSSGECGAAFAFLYELEVVAHAVHKRGGGRAGGGGTGNSTQGVEIRRRVRVRTGRRAQRRYLGAAFPL